MGYDTWNDRRYHNFISMRIKTEFIEHRHDQAILTNLAIREGYKLHFWSVQYGDNARSKYPADKYPSHFFEHHRYRNNEY